MRSASFSLERVGEIQSLVENEKYVLSPLVISKFDEDSAPETLIQFLNLDDGSL